MIYCPFSSIPVTSYGLGGAIPFALELVRQLAGEAEADRIRSAIAYRH